MNHHVNAIAGRPLAESGGMPPHSKKNTDTGRCAVPVTRFIKNQSGGSVLLHIPDLGEDFLYCGIGAKELEGIIAFNCRGIAIPLFDSLS